MKMITQKIPLLTKEEIKRFWKKVKICGFDDCWPWQACKVWGYGRVSIRDKLFRAHRVAWRITKGLIPQGLCVLHDCDNSLCCNPYHLFLGTHQENRQDASKKGRLPRGEKHWKASLTTSEVQEIRHRYEEKETSMTILGEEYGVTRQAVWKIICRKTWRHLK